MSILGDPNYGRIRQLTKEALERMSDSDLLLSYTVLDVEFEFPECVKYPNIPTRVDDNVDIYALKGRSCITGCEYLVARNKGCRITLVEGVQVPFLKNEGEEPSSEEDYNILYKTPFRHIIKELQGKRRKEAKKSFYNLMYKQIGNSIYGQVSMGLSGKNRYDVKTDSFVRIPGGTLSNPVMASYITGFTRALLGECLNNIQALGGKVVSCTTDGFITDVENLEEKLLKLEGIQCLKLFRQMRRLLTEGDSRPDPSALEVKNIENQGLLS